jgi:methyl-accepting chemotaxis protein
MSDSVRIDIHATDNASKVFGAVGGAAAKMGNQLDDVGDAFTALTKDYGMTEAAARDLLASQGMVVSSLDKVDTAATDASRGINKLETETKQLAPALKQTGDAARTAGNNFKEYESELRQVGLGVGVLAGAMALSGQSFRNQEIAIDNLRRTYGDAADGLVDFADEIQRTTNFSNDAAIAAANSFGTLARNYELSVSQIEALIARSADLAATSGFSLEEAAQRVQAAIRGEAESAEMLGLTMNQMTSPHSQWARRKRRPTRSTAR